MSAARGLLAVPLLALLAALPLLGAAAATEVSPDDARAILKDVLATPEFVRAGGPSAVDRWLEQARQWLAHLLRRIGAPDSVGTQLASALAWTLAIAAVAILLIAVLRRRRRPVTSGGTRVLAEPRRPSGEWLSRLATAMERGDVREAARCAYLAAIVRLEEQGVWRVDDARTPREYARLVPAADPRRRAFQALAAEFERAWYGNRPSDGPRLWTWLEECGCTHE